MFEDRLESALGNARALADLATETENEVRQLGCRKLRVAAAWADAHSDVDHPAGGMLVERLLPFGPAGCPPVAETCTGSLALASRTSSQSAKGWITDALTVRHRLPALPRPPSGRPGEGSVGAGRRAPDRPDRSVGR
jgi:hypothetical protein